MQAAEGFCSAVTVPPLHCQELGNRSSTHSLTSVLVNLLYVVNFSAVHCFIFNLKDDI